MALSRHTGILGRLFLLLLMPALPAAFAAPGDQESRPEARVARTAQAPVIDGVLEPEIWASAPSIGPLTQVEPNQGSAPSEATDVRFLYDDDNLYVAIRCYDSEPWKIVATQAARDAQLDPDDRVELIFDTFLDYRNAYFFQMSPAGSKGDALLSGDSTDFNKPWDGIWEGKTTIDAEGWVAEMAIPFKTLSFAKGSTTWGFNINRTIKRKNERLRWASPTQDARGHQSSRAGNLVGFHDLRQGVGLDVVPFGVADWSKDYRAPGNDEDFDADGGADIFYRLTPNLTASVTLNTDFAETEVDERKVNLTRFPLFFPEKRDFFLQDAGIFKFADLDTDLIPFFSRRIGRGPAGDEVPIHAGAKLTGRQDGWNIGILDVETGDSIGAEGENLAVARVSKDIGEEWSIGAIGTRGDPDLDTENVVYGLDANFRTNAGLGGKRTTTSAWFLQSYTEHAAGDDTAFGASIAYPNDRWRWNLAAKQIDDNFRPALGFVPRTGVRRYDGELLFKPRIGGAVRQLSFGLEDSLVTDLDDDVETHVSTARVLGIDFESGDELSLKVEQTREVLDQAFAITPAVVLPPGTYDDTALRMELSTAGKRPISLSTNVTAGEFLDGESLRWFAQLSWRPDPLFNAGLEWEQNNIDFDLGDVETQVARVRLNFNFTPDLSWNNFVQWDSQSDEFGLNSRWRWIPVPGQEFFLVFNQVSENSGGVHDVSQGLAFKASYTLRF